ncbi:hypothetical protein [Pseudooceanicola sp.]|uniref:hypothetical protein n=1 Tax=Pseudooceanicola sp. TaxID=1914328 RepID=UPI003511D9A3
MIELLIVFVLATIGIYFTTTTPESMDRKNVDDDFYDEGAPEDEGGIGILGIDVGSKRKHIRKARIAARERVAMLRRTPEPVADATVSDAETDAAIRSVLTGAEWDEGGAGVAPAGAETYDEDEESDAPIPPLVARNATAAPATAGSGPDRAAEPAEIAETEGAPEPVSATAPPPEEDREGAAAEAAAADTPGEDEDPDFDAAISAAIRAEFEEQQSDRATAARAPRRGPDRAGPPVIDEFDPDEDQIVIGYSPDEAGDGRIGISEDPTWPGTARVTLGGKVVALVPGGYGLVQPYHIELRPLHNAA